MEALQLDFADACDSFLWFSAKDGWVNDLDGSMDLLMKLQPKTYEFKTEEFPNMTLRDGQQYGFIAQEIEQVFPTLVKESLQPAEKLDEEVIGEDIEFKAVDYISLIPVMVAGMQEQHEVIEAQNAELEYLHAELQAIKEELAASAGNNAEGRIGAGTDVLANDDVAVLYQNDPNPFMDRTVIRYSLPETTQTATMLLFDLQGTQIAKYPLEINPEGKLTLDAGAMKPGMYIYAMIADGKQIDSKRMILTN